MKPPVDAIFLSTEWRPPLLLWRHPIIARRQSACSPVPRHRR
jgi:hypothetical protein